MQMDLVRGVDIGTAVEQEARDLEIRREDKGRGPSLPERRLVTMIMVACMLM